MGMLKEFREFAMRGNVVDMAVGIIIGGAFGKIVTSLVNDVVMPPIGALLGQVDFSQIAITLVEQTPTHDAVVIRVGTFFNALLDFIIVAFVIFMVIRQMNRLKKQAPPPESTLKQCPYCQSDIAKAATRCPQCTSQLAEAGA